MPPLPFFVSGRPRHCELLDDTPINTLGYLPMRGQRPSWVTAWGRPGVRRRLRAEPPKWEPGPPRWAPAEWLTARRKGSAGLTIAAMYNTAPSFHRLVLNRLPAPGRLDFDTDRCTVAPALAFRLAGGRRGEHLVHRLQWEDKGKVILGKLAATLLVTGFRALTE